MEILPSSASNEAIGTRDFWQPLVARPKEMLDRGETVRAKEPKHQIMKGDLAEPISGQLHYRGSVAVRAVAIDVPSYPITIFSSHVMLVETRHDFAGRHMP
jgi:hypothetical protein